MAGVRQFDEQDAFDRALAVFGVRGFRATSMSDLATGTGVQRGSLYHAYGSKEEIFLRAFRGFAERFLAGAAAALDQPEKRGALHSLFDFCVRSITAESRGCLSTRTAVDAETPRVEAAVLELLDRLEALVSDALTTIDDDTRLTVPPRDAARLVVATTRGIAVFERLGHGPDQLMDIAKTQVAALLAG